MSLAPKGREEESPHSEGRQLATCTAEEGLGGGGIAVAAGGAISSSSGPPLFPGDARLDLATADLGRCCRTGSVVPGYGVPGPEASRLLNAMGGFQGGMFRANGTSGL